MQRTQVIAVVVIVVVVAVAIAVFVRWIPRMTVRLSKRRRWTMKARARRAAKRVTVGQEREEGVVVLACQERRVSVVACQTRGQDGQRTHAVAVVSIVVGCIPRIFGLDSRPLMGTRRPTVILTAGYGRAR